MTPVDKSAVVKALREMSAYLQLKGENAFKTRAYDIAADRIAGLSDDLAQLVAEGKLTGLPGIGESIGKKISEYVTTGRMTALEDLKKEFPPRFLELLEVQSLGPKKAKALFEQLGVGSIDDLENACRQRQVRGLKGFGPKTEKKLLAAVALARRQQSSGARKRLGDVLPTANEMLDWVKAAPKVQRASLAGSVRRMKETVADVDIIASAPNAAQVFAHFERHPKKSEVLASGESKASVRLKELDLQVDLRVLPDEDFASALHHLPVDLICAEELQGNVHAHSTWSDGRDSLEAMARAAKALGLTYLTVTEHSRTSGYAGGLTVDRLKAQWDEIDRINDTVKGITLLKGVESDLLEDGSLDYPDSILEKLDVVIGSIHQRYGQDEEALTRRVLNAFDNPHLHIWGHPSGRLLLKREAAPLRMEEILDKAAEKRIAIEVNGCPERMDLAPEYVRQALQRGIKLVVSTDAHSVGELSSHIPFAIAAARRGWARKADVLNALPARDFVKALRRV